MLESMASVMKTVSICAWRPLRFLVLCGGAPSGNSATQRPKFIAGSRYETRRCEALGALNDGGCGLGTDSSDAHVHRKPTATSGYRQRPGQMQAYQPDTRPKKLILAQTCGSPVREPLVPACDGLMTVGPRGRSLISHPSPNSWTRIAESAAGCAGLCGEERQPAGLNAGRPVAFRIRLTLTERC